MMGGEDEFHLLEDLGEALLLYVYVYKLGKVIELCTRPVVTITETIGIG